ncbi:GATS protein-like 3 [Dissophora ornata]|nr:GATS protein-like 3 [Dissophora ornata]
MKLVLFPSGERHFFSYTETDKEVSLILDESHITEFPGGTLNVCNVVWRAVQIEPGESGLGTEEVISQVSRPLADIDVSIMQISTYDADFTLMPECDLKRALECLSSIFSISNDPLEDLGLQESDLKSWGSSYPMSPIEVNSLHDALLLDASTRERQLSLSGESGIASNGSNRPNSGAIDKQSQLNSSSMSELSLNDKHRRKNSKQPKTVKSRHPFNATYPQRLHITSMEQGSMDVLAIKLLESIFFDNRQVSGEPTTETTLSIIMDDETLSLFPEHALNTHAGDWRLIAIGDGPLGFDECGIVSEFSRPLSQSGINLFYLSTFNSDYIMVNDHDFNQAVARLHETANAPVDDISNKSSMVFEDRGVDQEGSKDDGYRSIHTSESGSASERYSESESESLSDVEPEEHGRDAKGDDDVEVVFEG